MHLTDAEREALERGLTTVSAADLAVVSDIATGTEAAPDDTSDLGAVFDPLRRPTEVESKPAESAGTESSAAPQNSEAEIVEGVLMTCPKCGWRHGEQLGARADDNDKLEFELSALGGRPFEKEFSFFGDKLVFRLRALTPGEEILARKAWATSDHDVELKRSDDEAIREYILVRAVAGLVQLRRGDSVQQITYPSDPAQHVTAIVEMFRWVTAQPSTAAILWQAARTFNSVLGDLVTHVGDPDFFKISAGRA